MKRVLYYVGILAVVATACQTGGDASSSDSSETTAEEESFFKNGIQWGSEDETANWLSGEGVEHWSNIEFDKAYILWDHSLQRDSTQFAVHTMMAVMSDGERSEWHTEQAKKYVADKNETSKKFVSLLDLMNEPDSQDKAKALWAEMREMSNGPWIHFMYARSLATPDDVSAAVAELDNVISVCTEQGVVEIAGAAMNMKAYMLQQSGDMEGALAAATSYLEMYGGHNAKDTMAEMHLFAGDTASAIAGYEEVLVHYPFSQSAIDALQMLKPANDEVAEE